MNGGRLNLGFFHSRRGGRAWPVGALFLSILLACGGDRSRAPASGESGQTPSASDSMASSNDAAASTRPDTATASSARPDSTATTPKSDTNVARQTPPKKPTQTVAVPKPAAPAPKPTAPTPKPVVQPSTDSATAAAEPPAAQAAAPTQASDASAPLRDQYHSAPLDTVSQQAYDGWKQFNLNCARCHGEDVQGTTIAPDLIGSLKPDGPVNTKELFIQTVCAGRPAKGMPSWCALGMEMDKIEAMYAYVKGRSDAKIHPGRPAVKSES